MSRNIYKKPPTRFRANMLAYAHVFVGWVFYVHELVLIAILFHIVAYHLLFHEDVKD